MVNIYSLLGKAFKCPSCYKEHYIPTELVESKKGVISFLPSLTDRISSGSKILLLADDITYAVAGEKIEASLKDADWQLAKVILKPRGTKTVHAEEKYMMPILSGGRDKHVFLTIGSGSITDMGKYAAESLGIPVVCFPTAPSMNAYTSGVAALIKGGLKVTSPVAPPKAVIIDTDVIVNAPMDLIQAGFADSMAKCYANADWRMSSILTGEDFCPLAPRIISDSEKKYITRGRELLDRNEEVISSLMDGLILAGFSMVIAGKSSPASGGEHLISHYLDVEAHKKGKEPYAYHGFQVGIGVVVAAKICERLSKLDAGDVEKRLISQDEAYYREKVQKAFPDSFHIVWKEFERKVPVLRELSTSLIANWDEIKEDVFPAVYSQEKIKTYLQDAGCPVHFHEIGVGRELAHEMLANARYIRDRLTSLDIADELGILEEVAEDFI